MAQFKQEYGAVLRFGSSLDLILENDYPKLPEELKAPLSQALAHLTVSALLMRSIEQYFDNDQDTDALLKQLDNLLSASPSEGRLVEMEHHDKE